MGSAACGPGSPLPRVPTSHALTQSTCTEGNTAPLPSGRPLYREAAFCLQQWPLPEPTCHSACALRSEHGAGEGTTATWWHLSFLPSDAHYGTSWPLALLPLAGRGKKRAVQLALSKARDHSRYGYGVRSANGKVVLKKKQSHKMHHLSEVWTPCISSVNLFFDSIQ